MDLSIIVVSFNTKSFLRKCLASLKTGNLKNSEVIVIDNASTDGSTDMVKKDFPKAKLIKNKKNLGFAKANNQAVKKSRGEYLLFLNSDTQVKPGSIKQILNLAKQTNSDISTCRLLNSDNTIQPQGGFLPRLLNIFFWMFFIDDLPLINRLIKPYQQNRRSFFKKDHQMGWVGGTAMLVKKSSFTKLNGFDEKLFMYAEDIDFCLRAHQSGMTIHYFNKPQIIHHGQKSGSSEKAILGEYQGLIYLFKKHKPKWELALLKLLLKIGAIFRLIIFGIIGSDAQKKEIYQKAYKLA